MENNLSPLHISLVEQLSPTTISISWSDACMGHYTDQIWRIGLAHAEAVCMLSGVSIRPGDSVFRPRVQRSHVPINHDRMILAAAVADLFPEATTLKGTET
ncbi:DUF3331 domain-containing protein [Burkholderia dolosa]|uniref:DUF3331 domain-containing protein n=1 Tax=Burkholderia dolosa TaxID=152500 RepID=UPI001C940DBC|nr:DUF3331 domain-containing protein [Burkholderia dolosa]MBY4830561.1 DUF3331 domain-containing protein [Burkholderia dolosa]